MNVAICEPINPPNDSLVWADGWTIVVTFSLSSVICLSFLRTALARLAFSSALSGAPAASGAAGAGGAEPLAFGDAAAAGLEKSQKGIHGIISLLLDLRRGLRCLCVCIHK